MNTFILKYWRGGFSLSRSFWLGWVAPLLIIFIVLTVFSPWIISRMGITPIFGLSIVSVAIAAISMVAVWRSSNLYIGPRLLKIGARATTVLGVAWHLVSFGFLVYVFVVVTQGASHSHDEDRIAEKTAIPSASHPMAGFWKNQSSDNFGLAVSPAGADKYSVSFCGPGGCFKPGTYRPNTTLAGDESYQIVDENTLRVQGRDGWSTYHRAPSRGK